ncbi:type II toxin-antitoxin system Phd/YefM family antitoxin [Demequina sp. SYSU T00192]|uniref:Antitoxin n=1 Tax=Demequina litoralis TaxID=3051660 RepID=A0ABT8G9X9_9MICO|nr:type II toxin-antitoxin system Phd/YefM family antitoxin [Demequina sp. SYSU T00192]MDN4475945.1 type II toxin-antitoxin system Phd/YefM family antitoxin [Demequina sp. SYSU T00192]
MGEIVPVSQARAELRSVIERAQEQAIFLERRGAIEAVIVSPHMYERMVEALEDAEDIAAADASLAEGGPNIPWEQVKAELGWS